MRKNININALSSKSVLSAIKEIEKYRDDLTNKAEMFVRRLCELGVPVIQNNVMLANGDSEKSTKTQIEVTSSRTYVKAELIWEGKAVAFIEFGSGIHYNGEAGTSRHPKGSELGYTIGSYGYGLGANDYWHYKDETGNWKTSHGTEATMPMYSASLVIQDNIRKIAREVFES